MSSQPIYINPQLALIGALRDELDRTQGEVADLVNVNDVLKTQLADLQADYACFVEITLGVAAENTALRLVADRARQELWDGCQCSEGYKIRDLTDPDCGFHDQDELRAALAAYDALKWR